MNKHPQSKLTDVLTQLLSRELVLLNRTNISSTKNKLAYSDQYLFVQEVIVCKAAFTFTKV